MSDEVIVCADCRSEFTFTESEAKFFASKGLTKPKRCKPCRDKRKAEKAAGGTSTEPAVTTAPARTQWVGGGGDDDHRRSKGHRRDRRRDRDSGDRGF